MLNFLVTGGAGFIGSHLVENLLQMGHGVKVIDNFSTGKRTNLEPFKKDIEIFEIDIRNLEQVVAAVKGIDIILHHAALASVPASVADPLTANEVNITGTLNVLESARRNKVKRVVFAASSAAYGDDPESPKREDMRPQPLSPYAVGKLAGEYYCKMYAELYDVETVAFRYFNVFGARQDPNSQYAAVIPKFITAMVAGERPTIFGDGLQTRDFVHINNVVEANLLAATMPGKISGLFNCACGEAITLNDVVTVINEILGTDIQPIYAETRAGDIKYSLAAIDLLKEQLHFIPKLNFKDGLKLTIPSYLK
jgi:nucleoside-diphosphate-sugar epimerase